MAKQSSELPRVKSYLPLWLASHLCCLFLDHSWFPIEHSETDLLQQSGFQPSHPVHRALSGNHSTLFNSSAVVLLLSCLSNFSSSCKRGAKTHLLLDGQLDSHQVLNCRLPGSSPGNPSVSPPTSNNTNCQYSYGQLQSTSEHGFNLPL